MSRFLTALLLATALMILDVKKIPELKQLAYEPTTGLTLGAAVSCARLCAHEEAAAAASHAGRSRRTRSCSRPTTTPRPRSCRSSSPAAECHTDPMQAQGNRHDLVCRNPSLLGHPLRILRLCR